MNTERPAAIAAIVAGLAAMLPLIVGGPATVSATPAAPSPPAALPAAAAEADREPVADEPEKGPRNAALRAAAADPAIVALGKENYTSFCLACHGPEGSSIDSPSNLFDTKWYHGGRPAEIEWTILHGVLEKGMPGWGEILEAADTTAITAYLVSLQK